MNIHEHYIMREQVRDLIPSIMRYDVTRRFQRGDTRLHLVAVAAVTFIYLLTSIVLG